MEKDKKVMIWIGIITIAIIGFGAYFLSRPPKPADETPKTANTEVLYSDTTNQIKAKEEKAVLVEFGDFQCPACASYHTLTKKLLEEYKDNLTFVFRNYPLGQHKFANSSAYAAEAAGKQGKYFEMFDRLYENQAKWTNQNNAEEIFKEYAKEIGLDMAKYDQDVKSDEVKKKVEKDRTDGNLLGVNSTPTFYLNGEKLSSVRSYEDFQTLVKAAFLKESADITGEEKYHAHFDLQVYLSGAPIDFSVAKFQETKENPLNPYMHFHDGNGKVVHMHKKGVTLDEFFKSLKMSLTAKCYIDDAQKSYCADAQNNLKFIVNGNEKTDFEKYVPQDLDRITIAYGGQQQQALQKIIESTSNDACIYSEKCPERGKPPTEECVGGLGTDCEEENTSN